MGKLLFLWLLASCSVLLSVLGERKHRHQYCIIGAGPGGLQVAYFLQSSNRDYVIFERNSSAGSFFVKFPRHRKLISINKRNTGQDNPEFNMRHDWNSLLSNDSSLLLRHYSKDFFPHADVMVQYLKDYASKLKLNIQYNTTIVNVSKRKRFSLTDQNDVQYSCQYLIVATGMWVPNKPKMAHGDEFVVGYEDMSLDRDDYEGKTVLILGRGNSAFETADHIIGSTNHIHIISRSRVRLSWSTHYVGDVRAVNNQLLDTYQLKSLDGVVEGPVQMLYLIKRNGKIWIDDEKTGQVPLDVAQEGEENEDEKFDYEADDHSKEETQKEGDRQDNEPEEESSAPSSSPDNNSLREPYDIVLRCLGFLFDKSIFGSGSAPRMGRGKASKYPALKANYESPNIRHMYFAGANSHVRDFKKSSGAFIHGFRYTARALYRHMEWSHHQVAWPSSTVPVTQLLQAILTRINEMSGPYQMFGILVEVIAVDLENGTATLFEEVPIDCIPNFYQCTGHKLDKFIVINLEYGKNFSGPANDVFRESRATGEPSEADESNFLHPVMYYYKQTFSAMPQLRELPRPDHLLHIVEDFLALWDAPVSHIQPLRRFLEEIYNTDLRQFFAETCFKYALTHLDLPKFCEQQYMKGQSVLRATPELFETLAGKGLGNGAFPA